MHNARLAVIVVIVLIGMMAGVSQADDWTTYRAEKHGFEMLVPEETKFEDRQWENGWAGLHATVEGVHLYGIAKIGTFATLDEIENFGVKVSGIAEEHWTKITEGANSNGWKQYRVYKAASGDKVVYAGLGTGPKGSYLLFLETTAEDVEEYEEDYQEWYKSLEVF